MSPDLARPNMAVPVGEVLKWYYDGEPVDHIAYMTPLSRRGQNYSQSHKRDRDGKYRSGGGWILAKRETKVYKSQQVTAFRAYAGPAYRGSFFPRDHLIDFWEDPSLEWRWDWDENLKSAHSNLSTHGAAGWNCLRKGIDTPDFSFATSLLELKDLPRTLMDAVGLIRRKMRQHPKKGRSHISQTGQWYLAIQFGWLPILGDIRNFVRTHQNAQRRLNQLIRDAERPVRRSCTLSENDGSSNAAVHERSEWSSYSGNYMFPLLVSQVYQGPSSIKTRVSVEKRRWVEGQLRYYLPPGPRDVAWKKNLLRRLYGDRVTPDTVYQLMPWSWLIDYFTGLGEFVKAVSPGVTDLLIANYAYLMEESTKRTSTVCRGGVWGDKECTKITEISSTLESVETRKLRVGASPFGWGLKDSDLSLRQKAIMGALGLSRLR